MQNFKRIAELSGEVGGQLVTLDVNVPSSTSNTDKSKRCKVAITLETNKNNSPRRIYTNQSVDDALWRKKSRERKSKGMYVPPFHCKHPPQGPTAFAAWKAGSLFLL